MKELSLNILDIAMNSVRAGAGEVKISIDETDESLTIEISDDGCGMKPDFLASVLDPFSTTRTTRSVGLGLPLLKLEAEQTGGKVEVFSKHESEHPDDHGTLTRAVFMKNSIDFTPLGDVVSTVVTLIQGSPSLRWTFTHVFPGGEVELDTAEMKEILGDVPLDNPDVLEWIREYLTQGYNPDENM